MDQSFGRFGVPCIVLCRGEPEKTRRTTNDVGIWGGGFGVLGHICFPSIGESIQQAKSKRIDGSTLQMIGLRYLSNVRISCGMGLGQGSSCADRSPAFSGSYEEPGVQGPVFRGKVGTQGIQANHDETLVTSGSSSTTKP